MPPPPTASAPTYVETLRVPLRWWAISTMFHATALLALLVAGLGFWAFVVMAGVVAATAALLVSYGSARIEVTDHELRAGRARIPLRLVARPEPLDATATAHRLGPGADARAHLLVRPYVPGSVVVQIDDRGDPTPYWLMSTRRPSMLAQAVSARLDHTPGGPGDVSSGLDRAD